MKGRGKVISAKISINYYNKMQKLVVDKNKTTSDIIRLMIVDFFKETPNEEKKVSINKDTKKVLNLLWDLDVKDEQSDIFFKLVNEINELSK